MAKEIYAVEFENDDFPEDRSKDLQYVGISKEDALKKTFQIRDGGTYYFSIWIKGEFISEYYREHYIKDGILTYGKWERNAGKEVDFLNY